jgi:hypothetical protein
MDKLPVLESLKGVLTVDVGVHTALAYWFSDSLNPRVAEVTGLASPTSDMESYLDEMRHKFYTAMRKLTREQEPEAVYIEGVQLWGGSLKSQTSARRGDLFTLSYLVGVYWSVMVECCAYPYEVHILPAQVWKGQLTKSATELRVARALGRTTFHDSDHVTDAVAMGLALKGVL